MHTHPKSGFTLIELLTVIAVITILVGIVVVNVTSTRDEAKNARKATDVSQYTVGLRIVKERNGEYPGDTSWSCLGNYPSSNCWDGSVDEDGDLNDELDEVMSGMPSSTDSVEGYTGYRYRCTNGCEGYEIEWYLHGDTGDCEPGYVVTTTTEDNLHCRFES